MQKLIATDLDGTLLNNKNKIPHNNKEIITKALKSGHKLAIITGRDLYASMYIAKDLGFHIYGGIISSSNGAHVMDFKSKEIIINHNLDDELVKELIEEGLSLGLDYIIYHEGKILAANRRAHSLSYLSQKNKMEIKIIKNLKNKIDFKVNKVLFSADPLVVDEALKVINKKFNKRANPIHSMPQFIDVSPLNIDKGISLLEIAKFYNIDSKNTYAFGDQINDFEMIRDAGCGIAMANADIKIKEVADHITTSNNESGVAKFIKENILRSHND